MQFRQTSLSELRRRPARLVSSVLLAGSLGLACAAAPSVERVDPPESTVTPDGSSTDELPAAPDPDSGGAPTARSPGCASMAEGYCEYSSRCYAAIPFSPADRAACEAAVARHCALEESAPGAASIPVRCGADAKAARCSPPGMLLLPPSSCRPSGSLKAGARCFSHNQCTSGTCTFERDADGCGTCEPRRLVSPASLPVGAACTDGFACESRRCTGGACVDALGPNATCIPAEDGADPCDYRQALVCNSPAVGTAGKCVALPVGAAVTVLADGAACSGSKGPQCSWPADCIDGICALPDPARCQ